MPIQPPELITINHDDYAAKHIGLTKDGRQFFLTTPFVPATKKFAPDGQGHEGREFLALYLFNDEGNFLEAVIYDLGIRKDPAYPPGNAIPLEARKDDDPFRLFSQLLAEIGPVTFGRIEVQPFQVERFGVTFGLIVREPDEDDDTVCVEAQPGNYMAFFEPWDSGEYDT